MEIQHTVDAALDWNATEFRPANVKKIVPYIMKYKQKKERFSAEQLAGMEDAQKGIDAKLSQLEGMLGDKKFIAGDCMTIADI